MLNKICAWCGVFMGSVESDKTGDTHGMCKACYKKEMRKLKLNDAI